MKVSKIPTPKKLQWIFKRMLAEQINLIQAQISDMFVQYKRSQFKLIRGNRRSTQYDKVSVSLVCQKIFFDFVDDRYTRVSKLWLGSESDGSDQCPRTQQ